LVAKEKFFYNLLPKGGERKEGKKKSSIVSAPKPLQISFISLNDLRRKNKRSRPSHLSKPVTRNERKKPKVQKEEGRKGRRTATKKSGRSEDRSMFEIV